MFSLISEIVASDVGVGFIAAMFAAAMTAYAGFGGGLVIVPVFALIFGPVQGIAIAAVCGVIGQIQVVPNAVANAKWSEVVPLSVAMLITIPLGTLFLVSVDPGIIRMGIGGFVLVCAFLMMANVSYSGPRGVGPSAITGLLGGTIIGTFGVPAGPVLVTYYLASQDPPRVQRANIILGVFLMTAVVLASLAARGAVETDTLKASLLIAPASIIGALIGRYLFKVAPVAWFTYVARWLLVAIGIAAIAS